MSVSHSPIDCASATLVPINHRRTTHSPVLAQLNGLSILRDPTKPKPITIITRRVLPVTNILIIAIDWCCSCCCPSFLPQLLQFINIHYNLFFPTADHYRTLSQLTLPVTTTLKTISPRPLHSTCTEPSWLAVVTLYVFPRDSTESCMTAKFPICGASLLLLLLIH